MKRVASCHEHTIGATGAAVLDSIDGEVVIWTIDRITGLDIKPSACRHHQCHPRKHGALLVLAIVARPVRDALTGSPTQLTVLGATHHLPEGCAAHSHLRDGSVASPASPIHVLKAKAIGIDGGARCIPLVALIAAQAPSCAPVAIEDAQRAHARTVHVVLKVDCRNKAIECRPIVGEQELIALHSGMRRLRIIVIGADATRACRWSCIN